MVRDRSEVRSYARNRGSCWKAAAASDCAPSRPRSSCLTADGLYCSIRDTCQVSAHRQFRQSAQMRRDAGRSLASPSPLSTVMISRNWCHQTLSRFGSSIYALGDLRQSSYYRFGAGREFRIERNAGG